MQRKLFLIHLLFYSFSPFPNEIDNSNLILSPLDKSSLPIILFYCQLYHSSILNLKTEQCISFPPIPISFFLFLSCKFRWCRLYCLFPISFTCVLFSLVSSKYTCPCCDYLHKSFFPQILSCCQQTFFFQKYCFTLTSKI